MATLPRGISLPTDVLGFVNQASSRGGTDAPGAIELALTLNAILRAEGVSARQRRLFAARFTVALEGTEEESLLATEGLIDTLADISFRPYWP